MKQLSDNIKTTVGVPCLGGSTYHITATHHTGGGHGMRTANDHLCDAL